MNGGKGILQRMSVCKKTYRSNDMDQVNMQNVIEESNPAIGPHDVGEWISDLFQNGQH